MTTTPEVPKQRAGELLYRETLKIYQGAQEGAQNDMNRAACAYADTKKPEDLALYQSAKARFQTWDQAIYGLTKNGGDWMRLDFPKT